FSDLEALDQIAEFAEKHADTARRYQLRQMLDEFRKALVRELDYRQEARNLTTLRTNLHEFERIVVPCPVEDYTTARVLTTQFIRGQKVTAIHPIVRTDLDGAALADELFRAYLQQVLID